MSESESSGMTWRDNTNLQAAVFGLVSLAVAVGLFVWSSSLTPNSAWQSVISQIAGVVLATGILSVGWELVGRRSFAREVLATARLSAEVVEAGITRVTDQYLDEVEWAELFEGAARLDVVVAYARTWRNTHTVRLKKLAANPDAQLRVFLPDPRDDDTMRVLADRFGTDTDSLKATIREAITEYSAFDQPGGGVVEVYVRAGDAVFSCYRFDRRAAVLTLYSHGRERRTSVPTFTVRQGKLLDFVTHEVDAIKAQSERVFPVDN